MTDKETLKEIFERAGMITIEEHGGGPERLTVPMNMNGRLYLYFRPNGSLSYAEALD